MNVMVREDWIVIIVVGVRFTVIPVMVTES